ncbi:MAG: TIR domain-containing protein [Methylobacteriaceae bacterium]|nr:TIR domain-containing protein [Methylobacteriaceae bacterium]
MRPEAIDKPVFISYASDDFDRVKPVVDELRSQGCIIWFDKYDIKLGDDWDFEIRKGLSAARFVIIFLSQRSITKEGYVQREQKIAIDRAQELEKGKQFILPVLLEKVDVPSALKHIQYMFADHPDLISSILKVVAPSNVAKQDSGGEDGVAIKIRKLSYEKDGLPGYKVAIDYVDISDNSVQHPELASAIVNGINSKTANWVFSSQLEESGLYRYSMDRFRRTHECYVSFSESIRRGSIFSLVFSIGWYGAGAAHGNYGFSTYCFVGDPPVYIDELKNIINSKHHGAALNSIVTEVFRYLLEDYNQENQSGLEEGQIKLGITGWESLNNFAFTNDGIKFLFPPYQIASFAQGSHYALVKYSIIAKFLKDEYKELLSILDDNDG